MPRFRKRLFRQPLPKWVAGWDWMVSCRPGGRRKRAPYSAVIRVNVMGLKINLIPLRGLGSWSRRSVSGALPSSWTLSTNLDFLLPLQLSHFSSSSLWLAAFEHIVHANGKEGMMLLFEQEHLRTWDVGLNCIEFHVHSTWDALEFGFNRVSCFKYWASVTVVVLGWVKKWRLASTEQ